MAETSARVVLDSRLDRLLSLTVELVVSGCEFQDIRPSDCLDTLGALEGLAARPLDPVSKAVVSTMREAMVLSFGRLQWDRHWGAFCQAHRDDEGAA